MIMSDCSGRAVMKGDVLKEYVFDTGFPLKLFLRSERYGEILGNSMISESIFL